MITFVKRKYKYVVPWVLYCLDVLVLNTACKGGRNSRLTALSSKSYFNVWQKTR